MIWDEQEVKLNYIGISKGDPATRADRHFHRDNTMESTFDSYCRENLRQTMPWKVYLIDPTWCDSIARKALFWDRQEYEEHMPRIEKAYSEKVETNLFWFLRKAESALITLYQPDFNVAANIRRSPQKSKRHI